jgi:hypothetical protein
VLPSAQSLASAARCARFGSCIYCKKTQPAVRSLIFQFAVKRSKKR